MRAEFVLPYPPSTNRIWRRAGHRIYLAPAGVEFRKLVEAAVVGVPRFQPEDRLRLELLAYMPDRRKRDLDNLFKSTLDALQAAGVFEDDAQIDELAAKRACVEKPGRLVVVLTKV